MFHYEHLPKSFLSYQLRTMINPHEVFTHSGQPEMQVEVIAASQSTVVKAPRLVTMRLRYPRIIHSEVMTHRVFSRNARSSRAVPVETMLKEVWTKPFIPWHWGKNQKGMQAGEPLDDDLIERLKEGWLRQAYRNVALAEKMAEFGVHKQNPNRLLEPFMWIDVLVTSTDWSNFLWLRDHKDAEPHLQDLARLVDKALASVVYEKVKPTEWHLPYIDDQDVIEALLRFCKDKEIDDWLCRVSAARCARISYKPFNGDSSYEKEIERYNLLVASDRIHASPMEHQATPDYPKPGGWLAPELHGNLEGWVQFRKTIPGERR